MSSTVSLTLTGVPAATLTAWLAQAQAAYQALVTGAMSYRVSYNQGMGSREVTYQKANLADLRQWIGELQAALGQRTRQPLGVVFR
ncbi:MAG: phage head-tail adapter protein [Rhodospirillales bacterium]|nr:phage head-tail adapter protein [Rhodospirillales bacterium]